MLHPFAPSLWLSRAVPNPAGRCRLWCLPFAGGGAGIWRPWAEALAADAEVVALRLPGRENRLAEKPVAEPGDLLAALVRELEPRLDVDSILCGHSLGGLLAFSIVCELARRRRPLPRGLIVSGVRAPHLPRTEPDLHALPDGELVDQLDRRYGGIPPELRNNAALLELFLPALRADLSVYEKYPLAPIMPLDIPILALGGEDDPVVSRAQVLDWRAHTTGNFTASFFPGGHFFIQTAFPRAVQHVRAFLQQIAPEISATR